MRRTTIGLAVLGTVILLLGPAAAAAPRVTGFPIPTPDAGALQITTGPDGALWFTETLASKVGRVDPSGTFDEFALTPGAGPTAITTGPDGNLWFTEASADRIGRLSPAGALTEFALPSGAEPNAIAAGPDGNVWFTEYGSNEAARITPSGDITGFPIPLQGETPADIVSGPDGALWLTEDESAEGGVHGILRLSTAGRFTIYDRPQIGLPRQITVGKDDALWIVDGSTPAIGRFDLATQEVTVFAVPGAAGFAAYDATAPNGQILFTEPGVCCSANVGGDRVGRVDPATGRITQFRLPTASAVPEGITIGPDGAVWVVEQGANAIARIGP